MIKKRVAGKGAPAAAVIERLLDGVSFEYDWDVYVPDDVLHHRALAGREGRRSSGMLTARARRSNQWH